MDAQQQHQPVAPSQVDRKPIITPQARVVQTDAPLCSRLHPLVQEKIRNLVANGETRLYSIRKQLRYVGDELAILNINQSGGRVVSTNIASFYR